MLDVTRLTNKTLEQRRDKHAETIAELERMCGDPQANPVMVDALRMVTGYMRHMLSDIDMLLDDYNDLSRAYDRECFKPADHGEF